MLSSIALPIVHPIPGVTECSLKQRPAGEGSSTPATRTIPNAKAPRPVQIRRTSRKVTLACWHGTVTGARPRPGLLRRRIRCWDCSAPENICGLASTPISTSVAYAKVGNEPGLLGYQPVYLLV